MQTIHAQQAVYMLQYPDSQYPDALVFRPSSMVNTHGQEDFLQGGKTVLLITFPALVKYSDEVGDSVSHDLKCSCWHDMLTQIDESVGRRKGKSSLRRYVE